MALNSTSCANNINAAMTSYIGSYPSGNFPSAFASAYKTYSQAGVLSGGGGVAGTEDQSILEAVLAGGDDFITAAEFGQALASYWNTCLLVPSAGSLSVSNNASSKVAAFTAAINDSYTTSSSTPYYKAFIDNIEAVVKTIVWTCIKSPPSPPTLETVS